jgi:hypothetical protein
MPLPSPLSRCGRAVFPENSSEVGRIILMDQVITRVEEWKRKMLGQKGYKKMLLTDE